MTTYTVYMPPHDHDENPQDAFRVVPDSKAKLALFFPPLWLAWQRLWLPLMVYFVVMAGLILLGFSGSIIVASYLSALPGLYLLLEGYQLVRKKLENDGWRYAGIVEAENREEAEIRYLLEHGSEIKATTNSVSERKPNQNSHPQAMSLFPE